MRVGHELAHFVDKKNKILGRVMEAYWTAPTIERYMKVSSNELGLTLLSIQMDFIYRTLS